MTKRQKQQPSLQDVGAWLVTQYDGEATDLTALAGGFWSAAFAYRVRGEEFVLRLGDMAEGYTIDAAAMVFKSADIPVPVVVETGTALGLHFAISERHHGQFVETRSQEQAGAVGDAISRLLIAMRAVALPPDSSVIWFDQAGAGVLTWHGWLRAGLVDDPTARVNGWRKKLATDARLDALFEACENKIEELLPVCPERRDLIHGDLLHQNVLVSEDGGRVTAVFSWKCSVLGDFLFDVAWCTFWSDWHPVIADARMWERTLAAADLSETDLVDAPLRHHCYELQIAASHLGWLSWTGEEEELLRLANITEGVLERGPLPT